MKFKYNFWEKKLWRIEDNCLYEISEGSRFIKTTPYCGVKIGFDLGQDHYLFLRSNEEPSTSFTACYIKFLGKGNAVHYEKKIQSSFGGLIETVFEFTEKDQTPLEKHQE